MSSLFAAIETAMDAGNNRTELLDAIMKHLRIDTIRPDDLWAEIREVSDIQDSCHIGNMHLEHQCNAINHKLNECYVRKYPAFTTHDEVDGHLRISVVVNGMASAVYAGGEHDHEHNDEIYSVDGFITFFQHMI